MWDVAVDLVAGSSCVVCHRPGRALCRGCRHLLPRRGHESWPSPVPAGLAPPYAAGPYAGSLRALVNAHKERAAYSLAAPLGVVLAGVVEEVLADRGGRPGLVVDLVPVPSRGAVVRRRGHDPMLRVARHAGGVLRARGVPAGVRRLLRPARAVRDQAGLGAAQRAENLHGAFRARTAQGGRRRLVVVDDVLTTGATAREAQRALEETGHEVLGIATICATVRRAGPDQPERSLPILGGGD